MSQPHRAIKDTICSCFYPTVLFVCRFFFCLLVFFRYGSQNLTPFLFLNKVLLPFHFGKVLDFFAYWYLLRSFYWQFGFFVVEALEFFRCGS
ncbi:unnamed protein product [Rhizophagus irregularis]|nr:unnamed protein product [Rhizophagus irregularis]